MEVSLRLLRYFVAAADAGSVTAAAGALRLAQPSLSLAIAQLEDGLGIQLFVRRHSRGLALTPAGVEVLRRARVLLAQAEEFRTSVADVGGAVRGALSIGCLTYVAPRYLAGLLAGFGAAYPEVEVAVREADQGELVRGMLNGELELALTYDLLVPRSFTVESLLALPPYALVAGGHRLARRKAVSLRDLADAPCVLLDLPISRDYLASLFAAVGVSPQVRYRSASIEAVRSMVGNGLGYTVLNQPAQSMVTLDGKEVRALRLTDALPAARVSAVRLADVKLRRTADAFLAFARAFFGAEAAGDRRS